MKLERIQMRLWEKKKSDAHPNDFSIKNIQKYATFR